MLGELGELVKLLGGIGGIVTPAYLIYDRMIRSRPSVFLGPGQYRVDLCIKNVASETIIIDRIIVVPAIIGVAKGNDLLSTVEVIASRFWPALNDKRAEQIFLVIEPLQERSVGLIHFDEFDKMPDETVISVRCTWRNTRRSWPFARNVSLKTTVKDIKGLRQVANAKISGK